MPYFENLGAELYYEDTGQGRPLIFLHGYTLDGRQWNREVSHFSSSYRTITLDARGHGRSTLPPGEVSPDLFWQDVVALMDHLDIPSAVICGLSMGSHVGIQVAIHAGERVEGLILIGAIYTNSFNRFEKIVAPINHFCCRLMPMSWIAWSMVVGMGKFNRAARPYIRETVGNINHDVFNRVWRSVLSMESGDGLSSITCPTLILWGDHDWFTGRQQKSLHEGIKGSHFITIKNAHHTTNFDNPEQIEQEIEGFLSAI